MTETKTESSSALSPTLEVVAAAAGSASAARATFLQAVRVAGKTASLRQVAAAAKVSPEQVRRILDGRAK